MPGPDTPVGGAAQTAPFGGQNGLPTRLQSGAVAGADQAVVDAKLQLADLDRQIGQALQAQQDAAAKATDTSGGTLVTEQQAAIAAMRTAETRLSSLTSERSRALSVLQNATDQAVKAHLDLAKSADPTTQAQAQESLQKAQTENAQAKANLDEYNATSPDRKAELASRQRLTNAQANATQANADATAAKTPSEIALAQANVAKANQDIASSQQQMSIAGQLLPGQLAQQGAALQQTNAQTGLVGAQTSNENATAARTTALTPGEVAQQAGTLGETNARAGYYNQLGTEAAARADPVQAAIQRAQEMADAYAKGLTPNLPDPGQFVSDMITAAGAGTTPFDVFKQQETEQTARLGQQVQQRDVAQRLQGMKASTFGGLVGTGLTQMTDINKYLPPGSDAAGQGFVALYQRALQDLGGPADSGPFSLGPQVQIPNAPNYLSNYASTPPAAAPPQPTPNAGPPPAAAADVPAATDTQSGGGHTITINIGGSGGTPQAFAQSDQSEGRGRGGATPDYLANQQMATPEHVAAMFGRAA